MLRRESEFIDEVMEDYPFQLRNGEYEPLDRILEMIDERDLAIEDLFISDLTFQYLEYIRTLENLDVEKANSFAYYASILLDLKVRTMMPKTDEETYQLEEDTSSFLDMLSMRKLLNDMRKNLENTEVKCRHFVEPEFTEEDCNYCIENFSLSELIEAYLSVKEIEAVRGTNKVEQPKTIVKDRFTVRNKIDEIIIILKDKKEITFEDIAHEDYTKSEKINAFLALLELLKCQFAEVEQDFICGEIKIKLSESGANMNLEKLFAADYDIYEFDDPKQKKKAKSETKDNATNDNKGE